jgi:leucyl aminopeptidase
MKHHTLDTSQQDAWRLVKTSDSDAPRWANPDTLIAQGIGFIDVTDHIALPDNAVGVQSMNARHPVPQSLRRQDEVRGFIDGIDVERMRERLTHLTSFENRYYRSATGVESAEWILQLLKSVVAQSGVDVTFETIEHSW